MALSYHWPYRWQNNFKVLLLVLIILPVLLSLGRWQMHRADEKLALQAHYEVQLAKPAIAIAQAQALARSDIDALYFRQIRLSGQFDAERYFLLDNRIVNGQVGYEVLAVFETVAGEALIVNRGWLPGGARRDTLPEVAIPKGQQDILTRVYIPMGKPVVLKQEEWSTSANHWPLVIQWIDMPALNALLAKKQVVDRPVESTVGNEKIFPYAFLLEQTEAAALVANWQPINTQPEKHWGYAAQWFLMALAIFIFWIVLSLKRVPSLKTEQVEDQY